MTIPTMLVSIGLLLAGLILLIRILVPRPVRHSVCSILLAQIITWLFRSIGRLFTFSFRMAWKLISLCRR